MEEEATVPLRDGTTKREPETGRGGGGTTSTTTPARSSGGRKKGRCLERVCLVIGGVVVGIAVGSSMNHFPTLESGKKFAKKQIKGVLGQGRKHPWEAKETGRREILLELNSAETAAVAEWCQREMVIEGFPTRTTMHGDETLTKANYITGASGIELLPVPKTEALSYLLRETDRRPERYARVTVARTAISPPDVMEYKVGPLSSLMAGGKADYEELVDPIPLAKRPFDASEDLFAPTLAEQLSEMSDVLFGMTPGFEYVWKGVVPDAAETFEDTGQRGHIWPFVFNDVASTAAQRISTARFFWYPSETDFQSVWMHPVPVSFRFEHTSPDPSEWGAPYDFLVCGKTFASAKAVKKHFTSSSEDDEASSVSGLCRLKIADSDSVQGAWDLPGPSCGPGKHSQTPRTLDAIRPKIASAAPNGLAIDWFGWSFAATVRPSTGLAVLDVWFKGERIAFEMAVSEASAMYSGVDADQVLYLDSAYSLSMLAGDLIPGVDCPRNSQMIEVPSFVYIQGTGPNADAAKASPRKAACVFEQAADESLWRHSQFLPGWIADGVPAKHLVVRSISAVGNYDYLVDFTFRQDGALVFKAGFAGFMETRYYDAGINAFEKTAGLSEIVHPGVAAPLHSHWANVKLDLDVLGTVNSFEKTTIRAGNPLHDGSDASVAFDALPTKYIDRQILDYESQARLSSSEEGPSLWRVVNAGAAKKDGPAAPPGYAIIPGPTVPQVLPDHHPFVKVNSFTRHTITVTKRSELEPRVSSVYDLYGMAQPHVSLDDFVKDDANIRDQDLVAWVTVGKEHIPRSEDVPLISSGFGAHFMLWPWNVFDKHQGQDISRDPQARGRCPEPE